MKGLVWQHMQKEMEKSVKDQLQNSLMNNTYFEVSLLLIYGHGTNVLSTWSFVSCLCSVLYFFSYCCHTLMVWVAITLIPGL